MTVAAGRSPMGSSIRCRSRSCRNANVDFFLLVVVVVDGVNSDTIFSSDIPSVFAIVVFVGEAGNRTMMIDCKERVIGIG